MVHILIADDDPSIVASLRIFLKSEGFTISTASTPAEAIYFAKNKALDLALVDLNYQADTTSGAEGISLVEQLLATDEELPIVCMTGWASVEIAVDVMKAGAGDFVQKPWENERLLSIIHTQLKLREERKQNKVLNQENEELKHQLSQDSGELIANSQSMKLLLAQLEQIAQSDINILITGENGTGKSLLANFIHRFSQRQSQRLVSINMGAISESLFESEMFGHVKGAFTDAKENRIGRVEMAENGTLFMDEIGNIPLSQQAKLLRLLEERQFERVGSSKTQNANIRVISATNADLNEMVTEKVFRQDLLYRLNTFVVEIPSLQHRSEDILPLALHFINKAAERYQKPAPSLSEQAEQALLSYPWPGNVRQLENAVYRAVSLLDDNELRVEHMQLPTFTHELGYLESDFEGTLEHAVKRFEATLLRKLYPAYPSSRQLAKRLGLSHTAVANKLREYGINRKTVKV